MKNNDYTFLSEKIKMCSKQTFDDINIEQINDLEDLKIDKRKSSNERILDFLKFTENPYIFKIKGRLVRLKFSDSSKTADDCLTSVLKSLYR